MTRDEFLTIHNIHSSYYDFFTEERVEEIETIFSKINNDYTPKKENIFNVFTEDLNSKKVLLLGMDPYPQEGIATGFSFEVPYDSWMDKRVNTSLKNIIKLIYKSYYGEMLDIKELRNKIESGDFPLTSPNYDFKMWRKEGVIFLNTALTVKIGKAGSHIKIWKKFTESLFEFIGEKNPELTYLLWGSNAIKFEKLISHGNIIKHKHPTFLGQESDVEAFRNGKSFIETMSFIKWIKEI